jgi:tetratricopeptide (TPR) repeat protein
MDQKMKHHIQAFVAIACLALLSSSTVVQGQKPDPAYLSEMPPPAKIMSEIKGKDPEDTIERQMGAFMALNQMIDDMAWGLEHRYLPKRIKPDELRIKDIYGNAYADLWHKAVNKELHTYDHDFDLLVELLAKLFSESFRDLYSRSNGITATFYKNYRAKNSGVVIGGGSPGSSPRPASTTTNNAPPSNAPGGARPQPVAEGSGGGAPSSDSPVAIAHFENGQKFFKAEDYARAIPELEQAMAMGINQDRTQAAYIVLGVSYNRTRQYGKTIASMPKAIALLKDDILYHSLGDAYERTLQFPKALEAFKEAVRLDPKNPVYLSALSSNYVLNNRKVEAKQIYETLLLIDKDAAKYLLDDINNERGAVGIFLKRAQIAIIGRDNAELLECTQNALKLNPTDPDTLLEIGFNLQLAEHFDEALNIYRGVIAKKPKLETLADAHGNIGWAYLDMKEFAKALPELLEASRLHPSEYYSERTGLAYRGLGQNEKAIAALRDAIRINPKYDDAYQELAETLNEQKQHAAALEVIREGLKVNPKNFILFKQLGITYYFLKQYPSAIGAFREAIRLYKEYDEAYFYLGRTFVAMGRKQDAMQAYTALKPLDEKLAQTLLNEINKP